MMKEPVSLGDSFDIQHPVETSLLLRVRMPLKQAITVDTAVDHDAGDVYALFPNSRARLCESGLGQERN